MTAHTRTVAGATCRIEQSALEIRVQWWASDTAAFERIRVSWRSAFLPHTGARWLRNEKQWTLPGGEVSRLRQWASSMFCPGAVDWVTAERPIHGPRVGGASWGGRLSGGQRAELERLAAEYAALSLAPGAPAVLVEAARRVLAKTAHPDAGGSSQRMAEINAAADKILAGAGEK